MIRDIAVITAIVIGTLVAGVVVLTCYFTLTGWHRGWVDILQEARGQIKVAMNRGRHGTLLRMQHRGEGGKYIELQKLKPKGVAAFIRLSIVDWVMKGGRNWWNYFWSGKWQPYWFPGKNIPARFNSGETFDVPKAI